MVERPPPHDLPIRPKPEPQVSWRTVRRSTVYAVLGAGLLVYEAVWAPTVRPALLVVYVALMGLPPVMFANEVVKRAIEREDRR